MGLLAVETRLVRTPIALVIALVLELLRRQGVLAPRRLGRSLVTTDCVCDCAGACNVERMQITELRELQGGVSKLF